MIMLTYYISCIGVTETQFVFLTKCFCFNNNLSCIFSLTWRFKHGAFYHTYNLCICPASETYALSDTRGAPPSRQSFWSDITDRSQGHTLSIKSKYTLSMSLSTTSINWSKPTNVSIVCTFRAFLCLQKTPIPIQKVPLGEIIHFNDDKIYYKQLYSNWFYWSEHPLNIKEGAAWVCRLFVFKPVRWQNNYTNRIAVLLTRYQWFITSLSHSEASRLWVNWKNGRGMFWTTAEIHKLHFKPKSIMSHLNWSVSSMCQKNEK